MVLVILINKLGVINEKKVKFSSIKNDKEYYHSDDKLCAISFEEFNDDDDVLPFKCKHYFRIDEKILHNNFRVVLNPGHHLLSENNPEDIRTLAQDMMNFIYDDLRAN